MQVIQTLETMAKKSSIGLAILLAAAVVVAVSAGFCGVALLYQRWQSRNEAEALAMALLTEALEIPVDESQGYYNKSEESPDSFGRNTGIVLPKETKPVYMIHSESLFPPYRLEGHVVIPSSEVKPFIQGNAFETVVEGWYDLSFLELTDELPPDVRPPGRTEGEVYVRHHTDQTRPVWWTYVLNGKTGDLWIQYNTE